MTTLFRNVGNAFDTRVLTNIISWDMFVYERKN